MYKREYANPFKKSIKQDAKRGLDLNLLEQILEKLERGILLEEKYRDHALIGNYKGFRECHIKPDWLLLYYIDGETIVFYKTGTHSDLFG